MSSLTIQNQKKEITKPVDLKLFNQNSKLENDLMQFYFKVFDFIKDRLEKYEFEKAQIENQDKFGAEVLAFQKVKNQMKDKNYLRTILSTLKSKEIILLKDNHVVFKNEQKEFILSLNTIEDYERLHLAIMFKKKEEKKEISSYILLTYEMLLRSQNSYNIEATLEALTLAITKKMNYCSLFAFEKSFEYFVGSKVDLEKFIETVRKNHEQKKSDAINFVNLMIEVLKIDL